MTKEEPRVSADALPWLMWAEWDDVATPWWCTPTLCTLLTEGWDIPLDEMEGLTSDGHVRWLLQTVYYYGWADCAWNLNPPANGMARVQLGECCRPVDAQWCCCEGEKVGQEPRTITVTLNGIGEPCTCHNGWPWRFAINLGTCSSGTRATACLPTPIGSTTASLTLNRADGWVTFAYGDPVFEGPWDGKCESLDGLVLRYKEGATHDCPMAEATATLATSNAAMPEAMTGPSSLKSEFPNPDCPVCFECPKPGHMYLTLDGLQDGEPFGTSGLVLNWSGMNGTWALPPDASPYENRCASWRISGVRLPITVSGGGSTYTCVSGGIDVTFYCVAPCEDLMHGAAHYWLVVTIGAELTGGIYFAAMQHHQLDEPAGPGDPWVHCFGEIVGMTSLRVYTPGIGCDGWDSIYLMIGGGSIQLTSVHGTWAVEGDD
jgi:hypothetical protein